MSEFDHQCALFKWARNPATLKKYRDLDLLEGSMNGVKLTIGQAGKAKAAGMLKGSLDIRLPVARNGYIGLSIEMKYGKNRLTKEQSHMKDRLTQEGHCVHVCYDWEYAKGVIIGYLAKL